MPNSLPALIFDLDGTLADSKPGIVGCLRKVLDAHGIDGGPLDRFIGPPVEEWTAELLPDASDEARLELAREYRACYDREGWMNNSVFPGVQAMLLALRKQGFPLYVCTSKQLRFADRILDMFELSGHFTRVYGDKPEFPSHSKVDLLASLLEENSIDPRNAWMIGDRVFDIQAAHANRVRSMAAGWGYGSAEECSKADAIAATPADVPRILQGTHLPH
jgi:phosphoglycolate phosphatase